MFNRLRMYWKFIMWMLRGIFYFMIVKPYLDLRKSLKTSFGIGVYWFVVTSMITTLCTMFFLVATGRDIDPAGSYRGAYIAALAISSMYFIAAAISVLYDKFLADYGKTFEILKK